MHRRQALATAAAGLVELVILAGVPGRAVAQAQARVLRTASTSVVKVEANKVGATGFLWPDSQHVVTALHVVDNAQQITVHFVDEQARITDSYPATVDRVLKEADLVLLRLPLQQARPALSLAPQPPAVNQTLDALGFPLNIAGHSSTEVRLRYGGRNLRSILPAKVLAQLRDYPDPSIEVLSLEGNLVPGLSGAPLLDTHGRICGIADGGLEEGAVGICWGIPAAQLERLAASTVQHTPGLPSVRQLFAADLQADVRRVEGLHNGDLLILRSRSFPQLSATADDGLGLAQLTRFFAMFRPEEFRYDIYQDRRTGASMALPEGASLQPEGDFLVARLPQPDLSIRLRIRGVNSIASADKQAVEFERELAGLGQPGVFVQSDPAWSYILPMKRGPLVVSRKAAVVMRMSAPIPQAQAYLFETVASNGRGFLGVAAVNEDVSPDTLMLEQACGSGMADPRCSQVFERRRSWAQMVLGVQFSSFPVELD